MGSGTGVTLPHLAQRLLEETGSPSRLEVFPARGVEVVRFVADIERMRRVLGVTPDIDPLAHLGACIGVYARSTATSNIVEDPIRL